MFKIFKSLLIIIWIIDIFNIDFVINGTHIAEFLDVIIPLNGWFWFFVWCLVPTTSSYVRYKEED